MIDESIIGKRFGRLIVEKLAFIKNKNTYWVCKCDCGNYKTVYRGGLTSGDIISCGCYREEYKHEFGKKHNMSKTKLYQRWSAMIQRCNNPKNDRYINYGGRGIKVCEEWMDSSNFIKWALDNGYRDDLSLERKNVNGNYEPNNCEFIPLKQQYENKTNSNLITFNGKTQTLSSWAKELGINRETLRYRIFIAKWNIKEAFSK